MITSWARRPAGDLVEHLRGSALGSRNLTNYIARSLLEARLSGSLSLLAEFEFNQADRIAFTIRVGPIMMLTVGDASIIGHPSTAAMAYASTGRSSFQVDPDDDVSSSILSPASFAELSTELVVRLGGQIRR